MPRRMISTILDADGRTVWPTPDDTPKGDAGRQRRRRLHHHRHPGRQHRQEGQPVLGQVGDLRRQDPPTGRLQDRHDERQPRRGRLRLPRPAGRQEGAGPRGRRLDGQQRQHPNDGKLSLDTSAPLWSAILTEVSKGEPIAQFKPPTRPRDRQGRRLHRAQARAVHDEDGQGDLPAGHGPDPEGDDPRRRSRSTRRAACCGRTAASGPKVTKGFFNLSEVEANFPAWQKAEPQLGARGPPGARASRGGPKGTRTAYFYNGAFAPFGRTWGAPFAPTDAVPARTRRRRSATRSRPTPDPSTADADLRPAADRPARRRLPNAEADRTPKPDADADPGAPVRTRRSSPRRRPRRAGPGRIDLTSGWLAGRRADGVAQGARSHAVDDQDLVEAGQAASSR